MFLPDLGFHEVEQNGYIPQKGDIVVFDAIKGHKYGHICMYNGVQWVSDFSREVCTVRTLTDIMEIIPIGEDLMDRHGEKSL